MSTSVILHIIAIIPIIILIYILGSFLWHSFHTQIKGLPPYINTYYKHRKLILEHLKLKPASSLLDLGCGDGTMLRIFVKHFGLAKGVGYDINGFAIRYGRIINRLRGLQNSITLVQNDLFNADLGGYDYIYLYLYPDFVVNLEDRLWSKIDTGTIVICNTFDFAKHTPFEIIRTKKRKKDTISL